MDNPKPKLQFFSASFRMQANLLAEARRIQAEPRLTHGNGVLEQRRRMADASRFERDYQAQLSCVTIGANCRHPMGPMNCTGCKTGKGCSADQHVYNVRAQSGTQDTRAPNPPVHLMKNRVTQQRRQKRKKPEVQAPQQAAVLQQAELDQSGERLKYNPSKRQRAFKKKRMSKKAVEREIVEEERDFEIPEADAEEPDPVLSPGQYEEGEYGFELDA